MKRRTTIFVAAVLASVVLLMVVPNPARTVVLREVGLWLDVGQDVPPPVDYVLALGGGESIRPFVGAALVKTGRAENAFVLRSDPGPDVQDGIQQSMQETIRAVYRVRGVSPDNLIHLDGSSNTTFEESRAARRYFETHPGPARLAIVTHDFHTRRAHWVFRLTMGELPVTIVPVSAPSETFQLETWWKTKRGFVAVVTEYLKLGFYYTRHGNVVWWLLAIAVVVGCLVIRHRRTGKTIEVRETSSEQPTASRDAMPDVTLSSSN